MTTLSLPHPTVSTHHAETPAAQPLRVGAVSYLNSKPLIEGLDELLGNACSKQSDGRRGGVLTLDYPSRLADQLAASELDVALIPSVEAITGEGYRILSDACVAARGAVHSVKLYSHVPAGEIRSLALDEGSRTSAALARTILAERYGVRPELRPFPLDSALIECNADAVLMIGDRAMHTPTTEYAETWDLGEHWLRWTGLPFVFAVWVARPGISIDHVDKILAEARDRGIRAIGQIAERDAASLGISIEAAERYLRRNLHFTLGRPERASLDLFQKLAGSAGVI